MSIDTCACGCGEVLPDDRHHNQKYVNPKHRKRAQQRRYRRKKRLEEDGVTEEDIRSDAKPVEDQSKSYKTPDESRDGRASARRGPGYERFVATEWPEKIASNEARRKDAVRALDESGANISRWMAAYLEDKQQERLQDEWEREPSVEEALDDFGAFCRRYWPHHDFNRFHDEWGGFITDTLNTGGRLLLLAPQRHSKSSTLRKYCVWRICKNPNIRILWISQAKDLAQRSVGQILDYLTDNEKLIQDVLGPGEEFRPPPRNNKSWTSENFTVGVRTEQLASPTMVALGKGGSILSRDADLIIVDDMQEHKHVKSPTVREDDEEWFFTDLLSRKLPDTGLAVIGSRQHLQDIYSSILKRGQNWTVKVYQVHDPACTIPEDDHEAHDESGCMLWPDQYPHEFMQEQRAEQGESYFQRNMMNNPKSDATVLVSAKDIERCKDYDRRVGEIPDSVTRVIAGIDPADAKPVAGVLWGWQPEWQPDDEGEIKPRRHVIDFMEAEAGIRGGREILRSWKTRYNCTLFILESNAAKSWLQDTDIRDFLAREGVQLEPHYTDRINKWSPSTGVVAMFGKMRKDPPEITLPWGDRESAKKMERLAQTFLMFDPDTAGHKHADDDLPMAAWFPQPTMDGWKSNQAQRAIVDYPQTAYPGVRTAYPMQRSREALQVA